MTMLRWELTSRLFTTKVIPIVRADLSLVCIHKLLVNRGTPYMDFSLELWGSVQEDSRMP